MEIKASNASQEGSNYKQNLDNNIDTTVKEVNENGLRITQ